MIKQKTAQELSSAKTKKETPWYVTFGIACIVLFVILIIDVLSKYLVGKKLQLDGEPFVLIPKFLSFQYTLNENAAFNNNFGLGKILSDAQLRVFFIAFVSLTTAVFILFFILFRKKKFLLKLSLAMIIAGALGNLYDRIVYGGVRDFIRVDYFGKELFNSKFFPIFNIADSSLIIGIVLFSIFVLFVGYTKKPKEESVQSSNESATKTINS